MISRRFLLTAAGSSLILQAVSALQATGDFVPASLDHIILGCSDLDTGIEFMAKQSGYRAAFGGSDSNRGTRNAVLALGGQRYLEILAPDPEQPSLTWHKEISQLTEPLLVGSAFRIKNIAGYAERLRTRGVEFAGPIDCSRMRPDGEVLHWKTLELADDKAGIRPSYIEWDEHSPHPSSDAPGACLLTDFHISGHLNEGPPPRPNLKVMVKPGDPAQLRAKIAGLTGEFELTSKAIPSEAWSTR